ncbi:Bacillolysin [Orbilia brochopaga]|nr:Bacillolysin [Drechslerella brochopaga]
MDLRAPQEPCFIRPLYYLDQKANDSSITEEQRAKYKRDSCKTRCYQKQQEAAWEAVEQWRKAQRAAGEPTFGYAPQMQPPDIGQLPKTPSPEFRCQIWDVAQSLNLAHPVTGTIRYSTFDWPEGVKWNDHQGDVESEMAVKNFKAVYDMIGQLAKRDSYDGNGSAFIGCIHVGKPDDEVYNNAFWSPALKRMYFGEYQTRIPDTVGHEMMHGVTDTSVDLRSSFLSGALNESISDCFGSMVRQWTVPAGSPGRDIATADWCIWNPDEDGNIKEISRSLKDPAVYGHPDHMSKLDRSGDERDDVFHIHSNCGIPSHAFYLACDALKATYPYSWDRIGVVWFNTVVSGYLRDDSGFQHFADLTIHTSRNIYSQERQIPIAIADAWKKVGITPSVQIAEDVSRFKVILENRMSWNRYKTVSGKWRQNYKYPLIMAIRASGPTSTAFGVYYRNHDGATVWQDLTEALALVPTEYIATFEVVQDSALQTHVVCASAYSENHQTGRLFVWRPFKAENIKWDDQSEIYDLIMPQMPALPSPAGKIVIGPIGFNTVYPSIFLGLSHSIARIEVNKDLESWTIASDLELPNDVSRVIDISYAYASRSSGVFVLCEVDGAQKLLYTAYNRPVEAQIQIPQGVKLTSITTVISPGSPDELIAGGHGLWTVQATAIGQSSATLQPIDKGLSVFQLRTERVISQDQTSILLLNGDGKLLRMTRNSDPPNQWQFREITDGARDFGLCTGKTDDGMGIPMIIKNASHEFYHVDLSKEPNSWSTKPFF